MKVWLLYTYYYDFCETWDCLLGIYDSEEKAIMAQILEEENSKYKNKEQYYTGIDKVDVQ